MRLLTGRIGRFDPTMSQRFFRCPHCRLPHDEADTICPITGKRIESRRVVSPSSPPPNIEKELTDYLHEGPSQPPDLPKSEAVNPSKISFVPLQEPSRVGEVLGGVYLVKGLLGRGATALVYEGEHQVLGRRVALKVMHAARVQSSEARRRFLQEAQAAASLSHANICQIYDMGSLPDGAMYCAMEYLQGEPLSARIDREGALPLIDVVEFGLQILMGLLSAHQKGIIHRDIKPENVFLAQIPGVSRPLVKLLDFGLAKVFHASDDEMVESSEEVTQITRTGVVVGTPYYMAPEAVTGRRDLDLRADLWATGVVLYLAAAGRLPFRGFNWTDTAQEILKKEPPSLLKLRPNTPTRLVRILDRAMQKDRERRYPSAMDFAQDLVQVRRDLFPR